MKLTIKRLILGIALWWLAFVALSLTHFSPVGLLNIIGFPFIVLVPGYLVVLLLKMSQQHTAVKLLFSAGFSLALLTLVALLGNAVLPFVHIARPLEAPVLVGEITAILMVLLTWLALRAKKQPGLIFDHIEPKNILPTKADKIFAAVPLGFVGLSILGAISLNNGGNNIFTIIMLVLMTAYIGALIYFVNRLHSNTLFVALFLVSLSLLFMTSLRGWYITGHDVQHEFRLFLQTVDAGKWSMGVAKDAYNACLSVTLLPTVFYKVLDVETFYVFKVLFQIIFALVPGLVFLINRTFVSKRIALLAALYFVSFPTFFTDMPMLNRQEIGLVFAGLALFAILKQDISLRKKQFIFMVMSILVIVSHYSTNYTMLALLTVCAFGLPILRFLSKKLKSTGRIYRATNLASWKERTGKSVVTIPLVIILFAASFVWSVQLTNTSGQLVKVFFDTVQHIEIAIGGDTPTQDTYFSNSEVSKLDDSGKLSRYLEQLSGWAHEKNGPDDFYNPDTYKQYPLNITKDQPVPLTPLGQTLANWGVPVQKISSLLRNVLARFLQVMMFIGIMILLFAKRYNKQFWHSYRLLQIGAVVLIGLMIVLPVLMVDYDLLRMTQQLLFFVGTAVVIASMHLIPKVKPRVNMAIASAAVLIMFSTMTGVWTAVLGGYNAQLNLYNSGTYYNLYYTHREDQVGAQWVNALVGRSKNADLQVDNIFVDRYTYVKVQDVIQFNLLNDIAPSLVKKNAYVFLGYNLVKTHQATIYFDGALITYDYPIKFLDDNKNLLYDNGGARVYR